ncbi:MAG TPA: recombinase family protein [Trebonia sp.]|nr:recombinase family protein [Trebonia sp.]
MIKFAFYGRVSTEDQQDPESSRGWQLTRSRALIDARDGVIVTEFFDVDKSRSIPWQRRPEATRLLAELRNPNRQFDAVVVGEPHRAFYGNQYGLTFPLFEHYDVPLWVPEVGGPIDPRNEAHDLVMSVFGGMSKGERNRIKIRVKAAMSAQAKDEGRFLGGRPPYGYVIADAGPHPNPAKAADGKRLHRLDLDPEAARVVKRIFAEFTAGHGFYAIAEGLTRDGIPSPSAHDPERNKHRSGIAWNKFAVRTILINPRYTGHQVWNKQRKDEVLIDVEDVALGHTTKLRWNETGRWLWSDKVVHPPIIDRDVFDQVQAMIAGRAHAPAAHKPHRSRHPYALRGCVWCGVCERRMQSHWAHDVPYYRCRFPAEYALANRVQHPVNVYLREDQLIGEVNRWLAREFAPHRLRQTITDLAAAQLAEPLPRPDDDHEETALKIAECDRKLASYRAALDAGASPATVAAWIADTEAEKAGYLATRRPSGIRRRRMTEAEIKAIVDRLADLARVLSDADPNDKSEIFRQLGLRLTYHPGRGLVEAQVTPAECGFFESVRGGT